MESRRIGSARAKKVGVGVGRLQNILVVQVALTERGHVGKDLNEGREGVMGASDERASRKEEEPVPGREARRKIGSERQGGQITQGE